jgi:hypothetical protein
MEVQQGIAVLLYSNLEGKIERFTIDPAQLSASDHPDLDFIYLGSGAQADHLSHEPLDRRLAPPCPMIRTTALISGLRGSESDKLRWWHEDRSAR